MINDRADEVIKELFKSLTNRYQHKLVCLYLTMFIFCIINVIK